MAYSATVTDPPMTKMKKAIACFIALATLSLFASVAGAQDSNQWSGNVALGFLASSGNTDTTALNFNGEVKYEVEKWHHSS